MQGFRPSALVPRGFVVVHATNDDAGTLITARSMSRTSACPGCGRNARRVHSRYRRRLADLPMAGRSVRLVVVVLLNPWVMMASPVPGRIAVEPHRQFRSVQTHLIDRGVS